MKITGFIWLEEVVDKLAEKHGIEQREVREAFADRPRFRLVEKGHHPGEDVYAAFGQTQAGRYMIVFFVYKRDGRALILSARDMTSAERRGYGKK